VNAIMTVIIGPEYEEIAGLTLPHIRAYVDRLGAAMVETRKAELSRGILHYEKLGMRQWLDKFDRMAFIDVDCLVRKDCPSLFAEVPPEKFGIMDDSQFGDREKAIDHMARSFGARGLKRGNHKYGNTGVMVASACHRAVFELPAKQPQSWMEQGWINLRLFQLDVPTHYLPYRFNHMPTYEKAYYACQHPILTPRLNSWIIHYSGGRRDHAANMAAMRADIAAWKGLDLL